MTGASAPTVKGEHVYVNQNDGGLHCAHCGDAYYMAMPCPLAIAAAILKAFADIHDTCSPQYVQPALSPQKS